MTKSRRSLHSAYNRLIERAAAIELLPARGMTPREQRDVLLESDRLQREDVQHLVDLLERCVYKQTGSQAETQQALRLCRRLNEDIPDPPPRKRRIRFRFPRLRWLLPPLAVVAAATVIILITTSVGSPAGLIGTWRPRLSAQTIAWRTNLASEINAVDIPNAQWASPPTHSTFRSCTIPNVIGAHRSAGISRVDIDTTTGVDGRFTNAVDPFTPPLHWTHRLFVYTGVEPNYTLVRQASTPTQAATGAEHRQGRTYTTRIRVQLLAGRAVPIPSPAPDAIIVRAESRPRFPLRFSKDAADMLYVTASRTRRVNLSYEVSTLGDYRSAALPDVPFEPVAVDLPENVRRDASEVIEVIGALPAPTYRATVRRLHAYFAGFSVCPIDRSEVRANTYLTVAHARKGVCRHRARTFFITANAIGIPTRLVENRTHSFCEVQLPNGRWRRLEFRLGPRETAPGSPLVAPRPPMLNMPKDQRTLVALLLPVIVLFAAAALWRSHREDTTAHLLAGAAATPRAEQRARRDSSPNLISPAVEEMVHLVAKRAHRVLASHRPDAQSLHAALAAPDMLPSVRHRVERICELADQPDELARLNPTGLQTLHWDCYYVMRWLQQHEYGSVKKP